MMLLRHRLQLAVLSLLTSSSAVFSIPTPLTENPPLELIKTTNSTLEPQQGHPPNLTYAPWPPQPYQIGIHSAFTSYNLVIIRASEFHGSRPVSVSRLQSFLLEFRENLEREYPIPSLMPPMAAQRAIDIQSYTSWKVLIEEDIFGRRMPTATALVVLEVIGRQLGRYGPANVYFGVREGYATVSVGILEIEEFGGGVLNGSLVNGDSSFDIS